MPNSDYSSSYGQAGQTGQQSSTGGVLPSEAEAKLREDAHNVMDTAKSEFDKVAKEATEQASQLADEAKSQLADVAEKAKGMASEQKQLLADQLDGVAHAVDRAAADLEAQEAAGAQYARMIADTATQFSETIKNKDVDELLAMAQDFGRKQPAAFLGAAALLGFAASRFVAASAKREQQRVAREQMGTAVDYNGAPQYTPGRSAYGASSGSDYPSEGRV
ncbi:MAG TPA: hypothetical protein VIN06_04955 [Devosia sp.]